jgi:hypothetical protein
MELSLLCESKIFLCIVDKVEKLTLYCSESNINNFLLTYISKLNQNKLPHKDILSNNDYKSLFNHGEEEENKGESQGELQNHPLKSKFSQITDFPNKVGDYSFEVEQYARKEPDFMNCNEKENELNLFVNNSQDCDDISNSPLRKPYGKEDFPQEVLNLYCNSNGSISSTDNNTTPSFKKSPFRSCLNKDNLFAMNQSKFCKSIPSAASKGTKRGRDEGSSPARDGMVKREVPQNPYQQYSNNVNKVNYVLNSGNLADIKALLPNLNFLSQNMGVINWVIPGDLIKNNGNDQKNDKL